MSRLVAGAVVLLVLLAGCGGLVDDEPAEPETTPSPDESTPPPTEASNASATGSIPESVSPGESTATESASNETDPRTGMGPATPVGPATPDEPSTDELVERADATTRDANETLPVDLFAVFARTARLMDVEATVPTTTVESSDELDEPRAVRDPLYERLNLTEVADRPDDAAAGYAGPDRMTIVLPPEPDPTDVEQVLVHEYVHALQYETGMIPLESEFEDGRRTTDYQYLRTMLIEGGAVWATDRYADRYQNASLRQSSLAGGRYLQGPPATRQQWAPYYLGSIYFEDRLDDPAEMEAAFDDPPRTTEELLHALEPGSERPTDLAVDVDTGVAWRAGGEDRMGEAFVRVVLGTELDEESAREAAAGWGNDHLQAFSAGTGDAAYVWTLRWDTAADADEFATAYAATLENRTDEYADETEIVRRGPRTVVVVMGSDEFRAAVALDGWGAEITVTVGERDRRPAVTRPGDSGPTIGAGETTPSPASPGEPAMPVP